MRKRSVASRRRALAEHASRVETWVWRLRTVVSQLADMSLLASSLTLVFHVYTTGRRWPFRQRVGVVPELSVERDSKAEIRTLTHHLQRHLNLQEHTSYFLLLEAVCSHDGFSHTLPLASSSSHPRPFGPYVIPLVCDQVWSSVLKSYQIKRLKVVVRRRPFIKMTTSNCQTMSLFRRELKMMDLTSYFPRSLREEDVHRIADDIFSRGLRVKPQLRKGVWPHLVSVFHPRLQTREERESYLSKLRLIYDGLKGQLQSQSDGLTNQSQHLYDSIHRDAVRTDPAESFYNGRHRNVSKRGTAQSESCLSQENIDKLVNITAVYTLEHSEVSYTQGMTDLLSPILYVMEREDDAYIVFAAMVQRISENFGIWCEGTLKKVERLRHLCSVLDPQLSTYLESIDDDAFALFFGMVLIECRREFSFASSFHLMEVIWAAALCMRQREDPNWSPLATMGRRRDRRIQASFSETSQDLDPVPTYSEWASFMSNRSPDVIRQVFGELQTYSAIPLTRSHSILCHSLTNSTTHHPPPLTPPPVRERPVNSLPGEQAGSHTVYTVIQTERGHDLHRDDATTADDIETVTLKSETNPESCGDDVGRREEIGYCEGVTRDESRIEEEVVSSCSSVASRENYDIVELDGNRADVLPTATVGGGDGLALLNSGGKERSLSEPTGTHMSGNFAQEGNKKASSPSANDAEVRSKDEQIPIGQLVVLSGEKRSESYSEGELVHNQFPLSKISTQEMSDMSSVSSANTGSGGVNDRGNLVAGGCLEEEEGKEGERGEGGGTGEGGGKGGSLKPDEDDDQWLVVIPDSLEDVSTQEGNVSSNTKSACDISEGGGVHATDHMMRNPQLSGSGSFGGLENHHPVNFDLVGMHDHLPPQSLPPDLSRESSRVLSATPRQSETVALATNHDPSTPEEDDLIVRRFSLSVERDYAMSPKQPFFDALETIATISRTTSPTRGRDGTPRPNSGLSAIITNLLSVERSAPIVTRESSLSVPFSDSFPLFICLAIIVQQRVRIIQGNLDFVGLSVLLNTQAGTQNLERTLRIARQLYAKYREYQRLCFGPRFAVYEVWLDNMGTSFDVSNSTNGSQQFREETAG